MDIVGAFTNALGTSLVVLMNEQQQAAENAQINFLGADPEGGYGTTGLFSGLVHDAEKGGFDGKVARLRIQIMRLRIAWEIGHEEFIFKRDRVLEESIDKFLALQPTSFRKIFCLDFVDKKALVPGVLQGNIFL